MVMRYRRQTLWTLAIAVLALGVPAGEKTTREAPLTETGRKLQERYAETLQSLQLDIRSAVPVVDEQLKSAFLNARESTKAALAFANTKQKAFEVNQAPKGLLSHRKGWVEKAEKQIVLAKVKLKAAATDADRSTARDEIAKWEADKAAGLAELRKSYEAVEKAKLEEPKCTHEVEAAKAALEAARRKEQTAANAILAEIDSFLLSDALDTKLIQCVLLCEATPRALATFAQEDKAHETLVDNLLADPALMLQMLEAGGAESGQYGPAMKIYSAIQKASSRAKDGILQRLALATSLEHAVPIEQRNAASAVKAPATVDPVQRYLHYEKAHLQGELDPAFKSMTAWECRMIVNCDAPDHVLEWGRTMLRNYRPDHISNPDYGWRYSGLVRTDVTYRSSKLYTDSDSLEFFQNVLRNGGICGRRAFFGRFITQCFGLPVWGVTQHKHAAVGRWTPTGWVVNLGANWQWSWFRGRSGLDFLLETQSRGFPREHFKAQKAQWISTALGEPNRESMKEGSGGLWSALAHFKQKAIVAGTKPLQPVALGEDLGEANESDDAKSKAVVKAAIQEADRKVDITPSGTITVPAAAFTGAQLMASPLGGHQLFCNSQPFSCSIDIPSKRRYALTAQVVTVHKELRLRTSLNSADSPLEVAIPYTCGQWQTTMPVEVTLAPGRNTFAFDKPTGAFALKHITLTPLD